MLATFCARLALGLVACLLLLPAKALHPRFYRTQFLTALGLMVVATLSAWPDADAWARGLLAAGTALTLVGALAWTLEPAPGGQTATVATVAVLATAFGMMHPPGGLAVADDLTAAALLGTALSAMLVGHSYLISPGLALTPLLRMLVALGAALALRAAVIGWGLWRWTGGGSMDNLTGDIALWLPVRWLVGIAAPLVFGGMALAAARIRSTQSATGILYVAVVCGFLGELLSLLLARQTGVPL